MADHEYIVSSVYKVMGTAIVSAASAAEAVEKGLNDPGVTFYFSDPYAETKMRAVRADRQATR